MFKTPMTFSPHVRGAPVQPSPSRIELWREELGIAGNKAFSDFAVVQIIIMYVKLHYWCLFN